MSQRQRTDFSILLERDELKFEMKNGRIGDIFPVAGDTVESLNFKRGVLSAIQNSALGMTNEEDLLVQEVLLVI